MILSSSDGTRITIDEMEKSWKTLNDCYLRILEINKGTYKIIYHQFNLIVILVQN
jgi:hypothetical protein